MNAPSPPPNYTAVTWVRKSSQKQTFKIFQGWPTDWFYRVRFLRRHSESRLIWSIESDFRMLYTSHSVGFMRWFVARHAAISFWCCAFPFCTNWIWRSRPIRSTMDIVKLWMSRERVISKSVLTGWRRGGECNGRGTCVCGGMRLADCYCQWLDGGPDVTSETTDRPIGNL